MDQKHLTVTVLGCEDAFTLLQIKDLLSRTSLVNICGMVTAVSEIIQINKDFVFLFELQYGVPVIVKGHQHLDWHKQILPGMTVVFTNLRPTTLSKNYKPPHRVYVPWVESCFLQQNSGIREVSLQDWLATHGVVFPRGTVLVPPSFSKTTTLLAFFQGIVTDSSQQEYGVFTLDNTTRLFLSFLPNRRDSRPLEVGDNITVYNIHQRICPVTQEHQLFCCVRSTIRISQKASTTERKMSESPLEMPLSLLLHHCFTMSDILGVTLLHQNVLASLGGSRSQFNIKNVMEHLLFKIWNHEVEAHKRNFPLEFLQHETVCPLANNKDYVIPILTQLGDLRHMAGDRYVSDLNPEAQENSDGENLWTFSIRKENTKPFLGWLALNKTTGRLQLQDSRASISVLVCSSSPALAQETHQCSSSCHCDSLHPGHCMPCPFIHSCCLGHLLLVTKYILVREAFLNSSKNQRHVDLSTDHVCYLIISTSDCILVDKLQTSLPMCEMQRCLDRHYTNRFVGGEKCSSFPHTREMTDECDPKNSWLVYITSKQPMFAKSNFSSESTLQFSAEGTLVKPEAKANSKLTRSIDERIPDPELKQKEGDTFRNKVTKLSSLELTEGRTLSKTVSSSAAEKGVELPSCKNSRTDPSGALLTGRPLALTFKKESCLWHDVIHPRGLYCFRAKSGGDEPALRWPQMDKRVKEAVQKCGVLTEVKVSGVAQVDRVFNCNFQVEDASKQTELLSVDCLMSDGRTPGILVNFRGIIVWRKHPKLIKFSSAWESASTWHTVLHPETLSRYLWDRCLCVGVKDLENGVSTANIFFNCTDMIYPLGLFPGVAVEFLRVDKRVSRSDNAYFHFLPVSSVHILSGPILAADFFPKKEPCSWNDTQFQLLVLLWQEPNHRTIFKAQCQICRFFRVGLKSICGQCGAIMNTVGCTAPACTNSRHAVFSSKISFLIEDGSCQALVFIKKYGSEEVARKLLRLSRQEWSCLERAVQKEGEIFIQNFDNAGGTATEVFVSQLCNSFDVRRPCLMLLQKSASSDGQATAAFDNLLQSDFVTRKINTGDTIVDTLCLPYLLLECLDVQEV